MPQVPLNLDMDRIRGLNAQIQRRCQACRLRTHLTSIGSDAWYLAKGRIHFAISIMHAQIIGRYFSKHIMSYNMASARLCQQFRLHNFDYYAARYNGYRATSTCSTARQPARHSVASILSC